MRKKKEYVRTNVFVCCLDACVCRQWVEVEISDRRPSDVAIEPSKLAVT